MNPAPDPEARKFKVMNACHKLYILLKGLADFLLETKSAIKYKRLQCEALAEGYELFTKIVFSQIRATESDRAAS